MSNECVFSIKVNVKECEETAKPSADLRHKFKPFCECHMQLTQPQVPGKKGLRANNIWTEFFPLPPPSCSLLHKSLSY